MVGIININMENRAEYKKMISNIKSVIKCEEKHCLEQREKLVALSLKYKGERIKYAKQLMSKKITEKQYEGKRLEIAKKIDKTSEKLNSTECQLQNCYKKIHKMVMHSIDYLLKSVDKKKEPSRYELIMKYKKLFSTKITTKDIIKFDQDVKYVLFR